MTATAILRAAATALLIAGAMAGPGPARAADAPVATDDGPLREAPGAGLADGAGLCIGACMVERPGDAVAAAPIPGAKPDGLEAQAD